MDLFWDVAASKHTPSQGSSERKPTTTKSTSSKADATKHSTLSNDKFEKHAFRSSRGRWHQRHVVCLLPNGRSSCLLMSKTRPRALGWLSAVMAVA